MSDALRLTMSLDRRIGQSAARETPGNTLSWTPFFEGTTGAGTYTYVTQSGSYTQVGKRVFIEFNIAISNITVAPTGNMLITGLPIASGASVQFGPVTLGFISNLNMPAGRTMPTALIPAGSLTRINLYTYAAGAGGAAYPAASFVNANCQLIGGGWYEVD